VTDLLDAIGEPTPFDVPIEIIAHASARARHPVDAREAMANLFGTGSRKPAAQSSATNAATTTSGEARTAIGRLPSR
jgi:hypothetical protein